MSKISLLILCAGFGKRMLDLTTNTPKPLLKIKNNTLLANTINFFSDIGCNEIFINTHYLSRKIQIFINNKFSKYPVNIIYEPSLLGTGGGIKNIFNYTKNTNICVVNSDIFWQKNNNLDVLNFLADYDKIRHCKILMSKKKNFFGLKKNKGDFNIQNNIVSNWTEKNEVMFYSGLQIVSKNIFETKTKTFSMNEVWNNLIINKQLKGSLMLSNIIHVGDKNSFVEL